MKDPVYTTCIIFGYLTLLSLLVVISLYLSDIRDSLERTRLDMWCIAAFNHTGEIPNACKTAPEVEYR